MSTGSFPSNQNPGSSNAVLGVALNELRNRDGTDIPFIIKKIVRHVEENGLDQIGIYRVNGNVKIIEKLKASFNEVGDADFTDVEIASVAGLLKLYLRALPDGIIPEMLLPHFVSLQQSYTNESSQEAIDALHHCLKVLPEPNYSILRYLIKHLAKVAENSEENKMTPISLSIVFGPNLFHCGSGLEGLRMQGYSNSIVCRMIQNHKILFGKSRRGSSISGTPAKPTPYIEHMKRFKKQESVSSSDANNTYTERSIDDAVQERKARSGSIKSKPQVGDDGTSRVSDKSPTLHPKPVFSTKTDDLATKTITLSHQEEEDDSIDSPGGSGFQRRNAKRGMNFKPRPEERSPPSPSKKQGHPVLPNKLFKPLDIIRSRSPVRTPSPTASSPGSSSSSPAASPRGSSVVAASIGASVKKFLFKPPFSTKAKNNGKATKQNVYGLLLPIKTTSTTAKIKTDSDELSPENTRRISISEDNEEGSGLDTANSDQQGQGVVRRRIQSLQSFTNRKSAIFGIDSQDSAINSPTIDNMKVKLVSVSPEHQHNVPGSSEVTETRTGKVSDLVKQFHRGESVPIKMNDKRNLDSTRKYKTVSEDHMESQESVNTPKKLSKAFNVFEKSGIIIGMKQPTKVKNVVVPSSSTSTTFTTSTYTISELGSDEETAGLPHQSTTTVLSTTASVSEEDVFYPNQSPGLNKLSSIEASDGETESPKHASVEGNSQIDDILSVNLDHITQPSQKLVHLTKTRPKGPSHRKKPRKFLYLPFDRTHPKGKKRFSYDTKSYRTATLVSQDTQDSGDMVVTPSTFPKRRNISSPSVFTTINFNRTSRQAPHCAELAPESKQDVSGVTEGWVEGDVGSSDRIIKLKELSQRIHDVKNFIRKFETDFIIQHKRRPSNTEKSPIRNKRIELTKLKKMYKDLKEAGGDRILSQTAPPTVSGRTTEVAGSPVKTSRNATSRNATSIKRLSESGPVSTLYSLEEILNKIMCNLESRRKNFGRPEDLELMNESQIKEEKHAIQKALLNFEKFHGRPETRADKEIMRPLYDRYRAIKRVCSGSVKDNSLTQESIGGLDSTTDSMLQSSLAQSRDVQDLSKSAGTLRSLAKQGYHGHGGKRDDGGGRDTGDGEEKEESSSGDTRNLEQLLTNEQLLSAPLNILREQHSLLLVQKSELRKVLRLFEIDFTVKNKRDITRQDRKPMEREYLQYKNIKAKLKNLEVLIAKKDPHKTI